MGGDGTAGCADCIQAGNGLEVLCAQHLKLRVDFQPALGLVAERVVRLRDVEGRLQRAEERVGSTEFRILPCSGIAIDSLDGFLERLRVESGQFSP